MERLRTLLLLLCIISLGSTGCKQLQPVVSETTSSTTTITDVPRDTVLITYPDSASIKAMFGCDSLNQVFLRELAIEKGRKIDPVVKWLPGGVLEVTAKVDSEAVYFSWKERHITVTDSTKVSKVTVVKEKPPGSPWYQKILTGAIIAVVVFLILTFIKIFKK